MLKEKTVRVKRGAFSPPKWQLSSRGTHTHSPTKHMPEKHAYTHTKKHTQKTDPHSKQIQNTGTHRRIADTRTPMPALSGTRCLNGPGGLADRIAVRAVAAASSKHQLRSNSSKKGNEKRNLSPRSKNIGKQFSFLRA